MDIAKRNLTSLGTEVDWIQMELFWNYEYHGNEHILCFVYASLDSRLNGM